MFKLIGKLIKFVIILAVIIAIPLGVLYVGSEVFDLDFCEEILDEMEDFFDDVFEGSSYSGDDEKLANRNAMLEEALPGHYEFARIEVYELPPSVEEAYQANDDAGYVFVVHSYSENSGAPIIMAVGVESDGYVRKVILIEHSEKNPSVDLFEYVTRFEGMNIEELDSRYDDMMADADSASRAVINGIADALISVKVLNGETEDAPVKTPAEQTGDIYNNEEEN